MYLPIFDFDQCSEVFKDKTITNRMFCAGYLDGARDACIGDSGGPLVVNKQLFGIVSWGIGCATVSRLGVYTYVPAVKNWIESQI